LPEGSIYGAAKEEVERSMRGDVYVELGVPADQWAKQVVRDLLKKTPSIDIWRGSQAFLVWLGRYLPVGMLDGAVKQASRFDIVEQKLRQEG
jgi:1-acylglycerone phosphate reductase